MTTPRRPNHAEEESIARQLREAVKGFNEIIIGLNKWSDRLDAQFNRLEKFTKESTHD